MSTGNDNTITIITNIERTSKGPGDQLKKLAPELASRVIDIDVLEKNLQDCIGKIGGIVNNVSTDIKNYDLDEVEVNLEIGGEGSVSLIAGLTASAKGGITLKFKKKKA